MSNLYNYYCELLKMPISSCWSECKNWPTFVKLWYMKCVTIKCVKQKFFCPKIWWWTKKLCQLLLDLWDPPKLCRGGVKTCCWISYFSIDVGRFTRKFKCFQFQTHAVLAYGVLMFRKEIEWFHKSFCDNLQNGQCKLRHQILFYFINY